ncbi:unnamed protein product, partial [Iphiclides podalirius]
MPIAGAKAQTKGRSKSGIAGNWSGNVGAASVTLLTIAIMTALRRAEGHMANGGRHSRRPRPASRPCTGVTASRC